MTWYEEAEKLDPHEAAVRMVAGWLEYARARKAGDEKREVAVMCELDVCHMSMKNKGENALCEAAETLGCMIFDALNPEVAELRREAVKRRALEMAMKAIRENNEYYTSKDEGEEGEGNPSEE